MISLATLSAVGGCGKSSTAISLGQLLALRGRKVCIIETDPVNMLSAQVGNPEWAKTGLFHWLTGKAGWEQVTHQITDNLLLVPFGEASYPDADDLSSQVCKNPALLTDLISDSALTDDTLLIFDTPRLPNGWAESVMRISDLNLVLMVPDSASLLSIDKLLPSMLGSRGASYFLMNRFRSNFVLHLDIWTMTKIKLSHRLIPFYLHEDQVLSEAFASGSTLGDYSPSSQLTEGFEKLANWIDLELG
ncbi:MAG: cellulose synthase operon protein YhjQ/BcsQ [Limnobacter sp.]|nr:cellulose synthase operon protein YhjQ/BcsQ [Limnobacter sp.]